MQRIRYTFTKLHQEISADSTMIVITVKCEHTHSIFGTHEETVFNVVVKADGPSVFIWQDGSTEEEDFYPDDPHGWWQQFNEWTATIG